MVCVYQLTCALRENGCDKLEFYGMITITHSTCKSENPLPGDSFERQYFGSKKKKKY